jgi:hypothetical protein
MFTRLPGSRICYGLSVARAPVRIRLERPPPGPIGPPPFAGYAYKSDRRDFHPLEWQLAWLHQIIARLSATAGWLVERVRKHFTYKVEIAFG